MKIRVIETADRARVEVIDPSKSALVDQRQVAIGEAVELTVQSADGPEDILVGDVAPAEETAGNAGADGLGHQAHFEVFEGEDSKWYWHLKAGNGEIVAQSEGYEREQSARDGAEVVKREAAYAATAAVRPS